ncbi:MAG: OmpH family outer membrane protein [Verrucomicrobiales bacterium]|nr:OmpH family outer membrane protein [Verrucomicrobiales bacterium]
MPGRALAAAEHNLAIINTEIVFKGYWRTAVEDKRMKNAMEDVQKRVVIEDKKQTDRLTELKKMQQILQKPNQNQAALARHRQEFETKRRAYEQNGTTLNNWKAAQQKDLSEKSRKAIEGIKEEIKAVISAQAKKNGYTLVIESKALLYSSPELDISTQVLAQLNINDPSKIAPKKPTPKK